MGYGEDHFACRAAAAAHERPVRLGIQNRRHPLPQAFIHGDRDDIVPFRLGRRLYDIAPPPKEFYEVTGAGHNDLIFSAGNVYVERIRAFLDALNPKDPGGP